MLATLLALRHALAVSPTREELAAALAELWIAAPGARLRREDEKKADELHGLLRLLPPVRGQVIDAAAGHGYAGVLYSRFAAPAALHLIEQDPRRAARAHEVGARCLAALPSPPALTVAVGAVADPASWPAAPPDLVVALHACGPAADQIIDRAVAARARWLFLVPCCHGAAVPFAAAAEAHVAALGVPPLAELRRPLIASLIDAERALRLSAAGYEVSALPFVPKTVTPQNLLLRARRGGGEARVAAAQAALARLRQGRYDGPGS